MKESSSPTHSKFSLSCSLPNFFVLVFVKMVSALTDHRPGIDVEAQQVPPLVTGASYTILRYCPSGEGS